MPLPPALSALLPPPVREIRAGGLTWTLQRVGADALIAAQIPLLAVSVIDAGVSGPPAGAPSEAQIRARLQAREVLACAAVAACEGEPVRLVRELGEEDREASPPRLWIGALPGEVARALGDAADAQDRRAADAIGASFPSGPADPPAPGSPGPEVRGEAVPVSPG